MMLKVLRIFLWVVLVLGGVYLVGPRVATPSLKMEIPEVPTDLSDLNQWVIEKESAFSNIKPNNAAHIIFNDSIAQKTKYSVVYLHGFSASSAEGDPVHKQIAKAFGANLYLPRLFQHGLKEQEPLLNFTAQGYWETALESLAIAKQLGEQVIVIGTSTGGALALKMASDPDIAALVLYSPNIAIFNPTSKLLSKPWGLTIARWVYGDNYHLMQGASPEKQKYWTTKYRLEGLPHVQRLTEEVNKKKTFKKVTVPVFMGYYYKNDSVQDQVVSVSAMLKMYDQLGTPQENKYKKAFPEAGDHVMTSPISSPEYEAVSKETLNFLNKFLK